MYNKFMQEAINEAVLAMEKKEVPVGAVIVKGNKILARAGNRREKDNIATSHAEILAIQKACILLGSWRLEGCDIYVTLEPCPMCAGAIIQSRIRRLYFGAFDPKGGACGSIIDIMNIQTWNHQVEVYSGIMEDECSQLLTSFFRPK